MTNGQSAVLSTVEGDGPNGPANTPSFTSPGRPHTAPRVVGSTTGEPIPNRGFVARTKWTRENTSIYAPVRNGTVDRWLHSEPELK